MRTIDWTEDQVAMFLVLANQHLLGQQAELTGAGLEVLIELEAKMTCWLMNYDDPGIIASRINYMKNEHGINE